MRRLIVVCLAAVVVTRAGSPASAQDVESLRREVEALRKQLQSVTERLQAMEARPAPPPLPAAAAAPVAAPAPLAQAPAPTTTESSAPAPTLGDYARPHRPNLSRSPSAAVPASSSSTSGSARIWSPTSPS